MRALLALAALLLAACGPTRPDPPPEYQVIEVPVRTYVPIDPQYTEPCEWERRAPIERMPEVSRQRKHCLEVYEADRETIRQIQGTPVPEQRGDAHERTESHR